jgi:hypothetical protein
MPPHRLPSVRGEPGARRPAGHPAKTVSDFFCAAVLPLAIGVFACAGPPDVQPANDYTLAWHAASERFLRAEGRLHEHLLAYSAPDLDALVGAEDRLGKEARDELRALADEGAAYAAEAVRLRPEGAEGHLYLGLNLALGGMARSSADALFGGYPGRIRAAYERALAIDPDVADGGAYRLKGKFLLSAPWPYGDAKAAEEALRRAASIADVPLNHLFLGDTLYRQGDPAGAAVEWQRVLATPPHPSTRVIDDAVHELARRRLGLAGVPSTEPR